ncbi:MAG: hypothetical protein ACI8RZ_002410 [Myxococcota bacterium]|jgi:hypothetical protein
MTALALLLLTPQSQAYSSGKTGSSTAGCTACHGTSADVATSATLSTKLMIVAPGDTIDIDLVVATTDTTREGAGLDVSVDGGTLQAGFNTQSSSGEITHSATEPLSASSATFEFSWIAPSQEGDYTFYAAGNAVNGNRNNSGDGWNTTTMTVTVDDGCDDLDGDSVSDCDGDCDDNDNTVFPGAQESCDGVDQNCDGVADNNAVDAVKVFEDIDGDAYGNSDVSSIGCDGNGYSVEGGDCDDTDPMSYPGAKEVANDGIDQDCDGEDLIVETGDTGDTGEPGGGDSGEDGGSDTGDGDKNSSTCSVISGMFGMGAVWLGLMGILRRRGDEE